MALDLQFEFQNTSSQNPQLSPQSPLTLYENITNYFTITITIPPGNDYQFKPGTICSKYKQNQEETNGSVFFLTGLDNIIQATDIKTIQVHNDDSWTCLYYDDGKKSDPYIAFCNNKSSSESLAKKRQVTISFSIQVTTAIEDIKDPNLSMCYYTKRHSRYPSAWDFPGQIENLTNPLVNSFLEWGFVGENPLSLIVSDSEDNSIKNRFFFYVRAKTSQTVSLSANTQFVISFPLAQADNPEGGGAIALLRETDPSAPEVNSYSDIEKFTLTPIDSDVWTATNPSAGSGKWVLTFKNEDEKSQIDISTTPYIFEFTDVTTSVSQGLTTMNICCQNMGNYNDTYFNLPINKVLPPDPSTPYAIAPQLITPIFSDGLSDPVPSDLLPLMSVAIRADQKQGIVACCHSNLAPSDVYVYRLVFDEEGEISEYEMILKQTCPLYVTAVKVVYVGDIVLLCCVDAALWQIDPNARKVSAKPVEELHYSPQWIVSPPLVNLAFVRTQNFLMVLNYEETVEKFQILKKLTIAEGLYTQDRQVDDMLVTPDLRSIFIIQGSELRKAFFDTDTDCWAMMDDPILSELEIKSNTAPVLTYLRNTSQLVVGYISKDNKIEFILLDVTTDMEQSRFTFDTIGDKELCQAIAASPDGSDFFLWTAQSPQDTGSAKNTTGTGYFRVFSVEINDNGSSPPKITVTDAQNLSYSTSNVEYNFQNVAITSQGHPLGACNSKLLIFKRPPLAIHVGPNPGELAMTSGHLAITPNGNEVYVSHSCIDNTVSVIDTWTNTVTQEGIKVGSSPMGLAITPNGNEVYVCNYDDGTVSVIDTETNTVTQEGIKVGQGSLYLGITPDSRKVYVGNSVDGTVSVITSTPQILKKTLHSRPMEYPSTIAITPDGNKVCVADRSIINVIDTLTESTHDFSFGLGQFLGQTPQCIPQGSFVITPDGDQAYVSTSSSLQVIDLDSYKVQAILDKAWGSLYEVRGIAITPDGTEAYVSIQNKEQVDSPAMVAVIDTASKKVITNISGASFDVPWGIAITPGGTEVYVVNYGDGAETGQSVSVIDIGSKKVVNTISMPSGVIPLIPKITPDGTQVYVVCRSHIVIIDIVSKNIVKTISGVGSTEIVFTPDGTEVYAGTWDSNDISVINTDIKNIVKTISLPQLLGKNYVKTLAITPDGSEIYVTHGIEGISIIDTGTKKVRQTIVDDGQNLPFGIGIKKNGEVYVADLSDTVLIGIDPNQGKSVQTIKVGSDPTGLAITPNGNEVYVSHSIDNTVSVINTGTNTVTQEAIPVGSSPMGLAITPDSEKVYVANFVGNTVSVITTKYKQIVKQYPYPSSIVNPAKIAITPDGQKVCVASLNHTVIIDFFTGKSHVFNFGLGSFLYDMPEGSMVMTPDGAEAYVCVHNWTRNNPFQVIDLDSYAVKDIYDKNWGNGNEIRGIAITPDGTEAYVSIQSESLGAIVAAIDTASKQVITNIVLEDCDSLPWGIAITPDGTEVYVVNYGDGAVTVINTASKKVVTTINFPSDVMPILPKIKPDGTEVYVVCENHIVVINTSSKKIVSTIANVGYTEIVFTAHGTEVYAGTLQSNVISVIDTCSKYICKTIDITEIDSVRTLAITPDGSEVYVTGKNSISIIDTRTKEVIQTISDGSNDPFGIGITENGEVCVTDEQNLLLIGRAIAPSGEKRVQMINVGNCPTTPVITPNGNEVYVANIEDNTVSVIDTETNAVSQTIQLTAMLNNVFSSTSPPQVAITPDGERVYLICQENIVSVIDTETKKVIQEVVVRNPKGLAITPDSGKVYVTNYDDSTVSVIDTDIKPPAKTFTVGSGPKALAITPDNEKVYVANSDDNTVSVIDTKTNTITQKPIKVKSKPTALAITPDNEKVYVANSDDNTVSVIDTSENTVVKNLTVGSAPQSLAVTLEGLKVYVANYGTDDIKGNISVIDVINGQINNVKVGNGPCALVGTPNQCQVYVLNYLDNSVSIISTIDETVSKTIQLNSPPPQIITPTISVGNDRIPIGWGQKTLAVTPSGTEVYVADYNTNTVSVINTWSKKVQKISVGAGPRALEITPDGRSLYVVNYDDNTVSVIDIAHKVVNKTYSVGVSPWTLEMAPSGNKVYVANYYDNTISVINTVTQECSSFFNAASGPTALAITQNGANVYVANATGNSILAIPTYTISCLV